MSILVSFIFLYLFDCSFAANGQEKILNFENIFNDFERISIELLYRINPGHCYTIITDPLFQQALTGNVFHEMEKIGYFVINVQFNEDMSIPRNKTLESMAKARNAGCRCYLMFLANGIQMEHFLRLIDRERAISVEANMILLYDYRLFMPHMFYIWKRFVNVIFIRQSEQMVKGRKEKVFELATVPFPLPITKIFVTRNIDFWQNGRFRRGAKLIKNKNRNMYGQPLNAVVLKHTPGVSVGKNASSNNTYNGVEIEILKTVASAINFTIEFFESADAATEQWGRKKFDGSYTGLIGEIFDGEANIAVGDLSYTSYHLKFMDLSIPYTSQCLTFLTPEALTDNSWQTLILPFNGPMWGGVLFFLVCVGFIFYILEHTNQRIHLMDKKHERIERTAKNILVRIEQIKMKKQYFRKKLNIIQRRNSQSKDIFHEFGNCILYTYSMMLVVSLPRLPRSWPIRLLTGWYWIYCISITVAYRASLTAILANPVPRVTIDTLLELATSPISCGVWGEQNKQFFNRSSDTTSQKIGSKIELIKDTEEAIKRTASGMFAYYENEHFLREFRYRYNTNPSNSHKLLHIMQECAINIPVSIGLEKNSPLRSRFDQLLRRIIESGLIGKWLRDSIQDFESSVEDPPQEALMDLKKLYGALIALSIGYLSGGIILIAEIIYWNYVTKASPLYDKYALANLYKCGESGRL